MKLSQVQVPDDLSSLQRALTIIAREILSLMGQPEYLALLRVIFTEEPRFPQLGTLFHVTVAQRGLSLLMGLLQQARERGIIADIDFDAVAHALLGGLLTYVLLDLVFAGEEVHPPPLERADALVAVIMRALK
ncbi:MAG: TetR/AcrR family transcriptional regulator C-terminal domain-containing protein [Ktedonobacteraceae bacterium]|nr:TetR/AcrR family transcriptional regulator C-terminal domain-containing protein [Ktedonobacteraceae bacterium]